MTILFDIKSRIQTPDKIIYLFLLYFKKVVRFNFNISTKSKINLEKIDIVIPTIEKDFGLLGVVIDSINKNIEHPINNIYIISKINTELINFCKQKQIILVDEETILGYSKKNINYISNGIDRSGWLFQQLLKLGADKITECENYLVIDSDTVLINKHCFLKNNKFILFESSEYHKKYFETYKKLLREDARHNLSFISHMMLFNKDVLISLKNKIEESTNKKWDEAIIELIDNSDGSYFSEFETYGNFLVEQKDVKIIFAPFYNKHLKENISMNYEELAKKYSNNYNSVSFHNYTT